MRKIGENPHGSRNHSSTERTRRAISRSSRAVTTTVRTPASSALMSASATRSIVACRIDGDTEVGEPFRGVTSDHRRSLADAAGHDQKIEPAGCGRHGGDVAAESMEEDVIRECCCLVAICAGSEDVTQVARRSRKASEAAALLQTLCQLLYTELASRSSQISSPGSTDPDRVTMARPSSGVKPIVVSTLRPCRTAASDAPAPRWQDTTRSVSSGRLPEQRRAEQRRRATSRESRTASAASARSTLSAARTSTRPPASWRGTPYRSRRPRGRRK